MIVTSSGSRYDDVITSRFKSKSWAFEQKWPRGFEPWSRDVTRPLPNEVRFRSPVPHLLSLK